MKNFSVVLASVLAVVMPSAQAANNWTQKGFERHLANVNWKDGSSMRFQHLQGCKATVTHHSKLRNYGLKESLEQRLDENERQIASMSPSSLQRQALERLRYEELIPAKVKAEEDYIYWTTPKGYACSGGWVTISNPQGKKVCRLTQVAVDENNYTIINWRNCRWK